MHLFVTIGFFILFVYDKCEKCEEVSLAEKIVLKFNQSTESTYMYIIIHIS